MIALSPKQKEIREREKRILGAAQLTLLNEGYYGMTMARIAEASDCPTGTVYQHFASKEDLVLTLAAECQANRLEMMRRGAAFPGRPRERMAAAGEGVTLFVQLYPDQSRIIHNAGGPLREKASPGRVETLLRIESEAVLLLRSIVRDALAHGDLELRQGDTAERITFVASALVDGGYTLIEEGLPQNVLGLANPSHELWRAFNSLADAYGWRPLFCEMDWEETLAQIRRTIFPDETQRLYGPESWYGDHGRIHPNRQSTHDAEGTG